MRLAEAAEEAGVVVRTGEAATVDYVEDRWAVSVNAERIDAPFVLLASGINGLAHRFESDESSRSHHDRSAMGSACHRRYARRR